MKLLRLIAVALLFCSPSFAEDTIQNVTFTDMQGEQYNLYELLESGKYVYAHCSFYN